MEDDFIIALDILPNINCSLFAILDGHGGSDTVKHVSSSLPNKFQQLYKKAVNKDVNEIINKTFQSIDKQLKLVGSLQNGCTCCMVFVEKNTAGKTTLTFANVGDSRCVMKSGKKIRRMTTDHKATNPSEQERIKKAGGYIKNDRVNGALAITRAFGDFFHKKSGVISVPELTTYEVQEQDELLLIASDGLWDVVNDEDALQVVCKADNKFNGCKELIKHAMMEGSGDNISIMLIELK